MPVNEVYVDGKKLIVDQKNKVKEKDIRNIADIQTLKKNRKFKLFL